jgi:Right handed beta helix region
LIQSEDTVRTRTPFFLFAVAVACSQFTGAAQAVTQRARVFVASYGSDSNPCSFTQPCRTFQTAVNFVANGGEVTAIDSAGFGPISITQSVTITSPAGIEAGIVPGAGDAIDINAPGGFVVLRGLTLDGAGAFSYGVNVTNASQVEIVDCTVRNFTGAGILVEQPAAMQILIEQTVVTNPATVSNGNVRGIWIRAGTGNIIATLNETTVTDSLVGVQFDAASANLEAMVSNSHIDANALIGLLAIGNASSVSNVVLRNVTLNQTSTGVQLGSSAVAYFSQVTITNVNGFPLTDGVYFSPGTTNNAAFSDGTSHLTPSNGTIGQWTVQ